MVEPIATDGSLLQSQPNGFLDTVYGSLFQPIATFRVISDMDGTTELMSRFLWYGFAAVLLISGMSPLVKLSTFGGDVQDLVVTIPVSLFFGVSLWCFIGLFVSLWAYAFSGRTRMRTFLTLSGLGTLPWLLMAPIGILRASLGIYGTVFCFLLSLAVWVWMGFLFALALMQTYRMSAEKVVIVLAAPFAMLLVFAGWAIGFLLNVRQLLGS